ncbi:hypothetical protein BXY64_3902 [Marinifilum flexuosum]|uniref:Uncharacterized protein n=1 Tax=Marinifilum flexuosum TaxID=1117708 RepID=A0A419WN93_9BACT|nr:hypothetical protein BXY64_3902 [Marinifilum flexuosum]
MLPLLEDSYFMCLNYLLVVTWNSQEILIITLCVIFKIKIYMFVS